MSKHRTKVSKRPRLKCNHPQRHKKQITIKNNKKMDLGKADIETIWNKFSHTKMNAVKEDHTCKKPAKESHKPDKGYSIEPGWRQSKTHSIPEHIIQPATEEHHIKQNKRRWASQKIGGSSDMLLNLTKKSFPKKRKRNQQGLWKETNLANCELEQHHAT